MQEGNAFLPQLHAYDISGPRDKRAYCDKRSKQAPVYFMKDFKQLATSLLYQYGSQGTSAAVALITAADRLTYQLL